MEFLIPLILWTLCWILAAILNIKYDIEYPILYFSLGATGMFFLLSL